jgi:non-heme chloroperoxidase
MSPRSRPALLAFGAVTLAAGAAIAATLRRWSRSDDPTGGEPLCLPDGDDLVVASPDGAELAVRVAGPADGSLMVLLHGWTNDRRVWGPVAKRLVATGHRVALYDQRGHGRSTVGERGLTLEALAEDLEAVLAALDARDAVVAGHSMGGMAAQAFAVGHPEALAERVGALVLVASACDKVNPQRLRGPFIDTRAADLALGVTATAPLLVRTAVGRNAHLGHLRAVRDLFVATPPRIRRRLRAAMIEMDLSGHVAAIPVPVTVVAGERDQLTPLARSRRIADVIPHAELKVFDDHGHMLPWEAPHELVEVLVDHARDGA